MIHLAESAAPGTVLRDHALVALAWSRHPEAVAQFDAWREVHPSWQSDLHIPVHRYTEAAGWCFDRQGRVRQLYKGACHALVLRREALSRDAISVVQDTEVECRLCQRPLTVLCAIDTGASELASLGLDGTKLSLPICEVCHCYGVEISFTVEQDGSWDWSDKSPTDASGIDTASTWDCLPREKLGLGPERGPMEATSWMHADHHSQIGGLPGWIQDMAYPACPGCGERMAFIAQVGAEDFVEFGEGIFYAFLCEPCRLSSATYQQT